jgi:hypothetical protein
LKRNKKQVKKTKSRSNAVWLGLAGVLVLAAILWYSFSGPQRVNDPVAARTPRPGRTLVATLSPSLFAGKTQAAYQAAQDVPAVLDEMPCFCGCMRDPGHQSNLYCFRDNHSAHCAMCQDIALDARDMWNDGDTIQQIRDRIVARYGRFAPPL